jgi:hypothetical protein
MQVVVDVGPDWPLIVATLCVGFGGAALGGLSIFLLELWRQVLGFRAAARGVRSELVFDGVAVRSTLETNVVPVGVEFLRTDTWRDCRGALAAVLADRDFLGLSLTYANIGLLADSVRLTSRETQEEFHADLERRFRSLSGQLDRQSVVLQAYLSVPRRRAFWDLLWGRAGLSITPGMEAAARRELEVLKQVERGEASGRSS